MELSVVVYQVKGNGGYKVYFKEIYILGNEAMCKAEAEAKGCEQIDTPRG